jgi:hypothetical protein
MFELKEALFNSNGEDVRGAFADITMRKFALEALILEAPLRGASSTATVSQFIH